MSKYFITFGCNNYYNSRERLRQEAINCGKFDYVKVFKPEDLSQEFIYKIKPYDKAPKGYNWWLFKAFILKKTFDDMEMGDFLVYADSGCTINPVTTEQMDEYYTLLEKDEKKSGMIRLRYMLTPEYEYTNKEVFKYFKEKYPEADHDYIKNYDILMNGILFYQKTENSIKYINEFYTIAVNRPDLFSDDYTEGYEGFKANREDQSVSSCLVKLYSFIDLEDHTYGDSHEMWMKLVYDYKTPILATRLKDIY